MTSKLPIIKNKLFFDNGINHSKFLLYRVKKHQFLQFVYDVWFLKKLFTVISKNNWCSGCLSLGPGGVVFLGWGFTPSTHPLTKHLQKHLPRYTPLKKLSQYTYPILHTHTPPPGHISPKHPPYVVNKWAVCIILYPTSCCFLVIYFTARNEVRARLCFYRCLSFC